MKLKYLNLLSLLTLATAAGAADTSYFADPTLDADVQAANQNFIQGNFTGMAAHIKSALVAHPEDEAMKSSLLLLVSRAYEIGGAHAISTDWKFPSSVLYMTLSDRRTNDPITGKIQYSLSLYSELTPGTEVEQVQLIQYPGKIVLDKQEGIGWYDGKPELGGSPSMGIYGARSSDTPKGGLYFLNVKVKGIDLVQGWFLLTDDMAASDSPVVSSPQPNEVFDTVTPTFKWQNFFSPQYQGYEDRRFFIGVIQDIPNTNQDMWEFYSRKPSDQDSITVGGGSGVAGAYRLPNGKYDFNLSFREQRSFGDLILARYSQNKVPFTVDAVGSSH